MSYQRTNYEGIRDLLLSGCYAYCRHKIKSKKRWLSSDQEHEVSFAYEQLDNAFDLPIERLMLEVAVLILDAGRGNQDFFSFHRNAIDSIMSSENVGALIQALPEDERSSFLDDLDLLEIGTQSISTAAKEPPAPN